MGPQEQAWVSLEVQGGGGIKRKGIKNRLFKRRSVGVWVRKMHKIQGCRRDRFRAKGGAIRGDIIKN